MDEDVPQFDALLGGTEELPAAVTLANFVAYRSQEIQIMKNSLHSQSGTKLAFQTLPKHMRRRAMSHNVKRLPRRLRQIHLNQMKKSGMPAKQKRPSRKYRRRPRNLIEEYTKRSNKKYKWLQTHIWHAKRFHMVEKWGYKLPCHPCDKAFRACYRATTQHCLLQDISYINCIEISGNKNLIIEIFKRLCRPNTGLTVGAKAFIDGNREGELTLFEMETSQKAIGTINFHWEPSHINEISKLWLWVHAAFYNDVLNNLIKCFQFNLSNLDKQKYYINESSGVKLTELAEELNRFRLTGPLANSVLHDTFVYNVCENVHTQQSWFKEYIESNNDNRLTVNNQYTYWKNISNITSVSEISPHIIISLIVTDPRLNFPKKRTKCVPTSERFTECEVPNNISRSPLWEKTIRDKVCESKIETSKIIELQSKLLVPGSDVKANNVFVPVLLIQRPGNKKENIGLGGGWDVILPSAWSKPFWIAMVMRGARVGGLRESRSILFEMGKSQFLQPDTDAGMKEEEQISKECVEKFFKKPPNKRINYNKFNIVSPFFWNWRLLIKDWQDDSTPVEEFVVLKDRMALNSVDLLLNSKTNLIPECPKNCLIPVTLECEKRGSPVQFAIICLPKSKNDFKHLVEPICVDKYVTERKHLKQSHQILLKKLRKQRKMGSNSTTNLAYAHREILENYAKKMRALWLPEPTTIRSSCSREVIGFVRKGGFSFSHGKSFATGYITANALPALVKSHLRNKVLFRNINTRQYRVAKLTVTVE